MLKHKKLIVVAVVVLSAMLFAVPSWCATFRKKISDQQFVDMCKEGNTHGVLEAINAGANVNAKNKYGRTALMAAAQEGHTEIFDTLIKAGANINAKDNEGLTALMGAAVNGHTETVNALIKAGAEVNAKNNDGYTALMWAAKYGYTEIVNALIEAGADDLTDNNGLTALIIAAYSSFSNAETINALIDAGSYIKQRDNDGKMAAVDYARKNDKLKGTDALRRLEQLSR